MYSSVLANERSVAKSTYLGELTDETHQKRMLEAAWVCTWMSTHLNLPLHCCSLLYHFISYVLAMSSILRAIFEYLHKCLATAPVCNVWLQPHPRFPPRDGHRTPNRASQHAHRFVSFSLIMTYLRVRGMLSYRLTFLTPPLTDNSPLSTETPTSATWHFTSLLFHAFWLVAEFRQVQKQKSSKVYII